MARNFDSGALTYAGIAIVLLVAIAALATYRFDLFNVRSLIEPADEKTPAIPRPDVDDRNEDNNDAGGSEWSPEPPDFSEHRVERDEPLPEKLVVTRRVGGHTIQIELRLVPQGPFIMGRNNGVVANSPQRWVWMDDYYMSTTEITNDQFFSFVLDGGYEDPKYWTQEGFEHINETLKVRGSPHIRWVDLEGTGRLTALSAPSGASGSRLTLEVRDTDRVLGEKDRAVLVLPDSVNWGNYVNINRETGTVRILSGDDRWSVVDGQDLRYDRHLESRGLLFTTDAQGQVDLSQAADASFYRIVAFADGDFEKPLIGGLSRGGAIYLRSPNVPVVGLTWFEADAVSRYFGGNLPTEAQWEKAGRGADGRVFPWGDELRFGHEITDLHGVRRYTSKYANVNRWQIMPVGSFPEGAGPYGHLDLVGNASEWCRDVYKLHPDDADANPYTIGGPRERRSERGSSTVDDDLHTSRLYSRRALDPYSRGKATRGFRVVFDPETALRLAGRE